MTTLRIGDRGEDVGELQRLLCDRLALDPPLAISGHFELSTRLAVLAFQSSSVGTDGRPLDVDGVVGKQTWWALTVEDASSAFGGSARSELQTTAFRGPLGAAVVAVAANLREQGAKEVGANNKGEWVEKFSRGHFGPWCAWFVSYCVEQACAELGVEMPYKYTGGARRTRDQLSAVGLAVPTDEEPMAGDLVVWWRVAPASYKGHIGIVVAVRDGMIWTIEGNRGAFPAPVRQFSYVLSREKRLLGFCRLE